MSEVNGVSHDTSYVFGWYFMSYMNDEYMYWSLKSVKFLPRRLRWRTCSGANYHDDHACSEVYENPQININVSLYPNQVISFI